MARAAAAGASAVRSRPSLRRGAGGAPPGEARSFADALQAGLAAAEPYLKHLVPALIVLFVLALAAVRAVALSVEHGDAGRKAYADLGILAEALAARLAENDAPLPGAPADPGLARIQLRNALPESATDGGRGILAADEEGRILASEPPVPGLEGRLLEDIVGSNPPFTTLAEDAGVREVRLPATGETAFVTVHRGHGQAALVALVHPLSAVFAPWRRQTAREAAVFVATGVFLLLLGMAFHAQSARADAADGASSQLQERVHTALRRGRAALWDWDLSRGIMVWSPSMFGMLGQVASERPMSVGDVEALLHPDDVDLLDLGNEALSEGDAQINRDFRMKHADGRWIWMRARGEVVRDRDDCPHLIGGVADITDYKTLAEASRAADRRLHDAIEALGEAFVLWDAGNRLVLCNSKYRELYGLTEDVVQAGAEYGAVVAGGRQPTASNSLTLPDDAETGARSVEARLEDGRWLQINERRTDEGGFVSVCTDITALKDHERQLLENQQRLLATVADLKHSRLQLEKQAQQLLELAEKYAQEKERAEAGSRTKSVFLANMSHEFRTPLNAIIGFSEVMLAGVFGPLDGKYVEYTNDILRSAHFLLEVITDILDMARLETGSVELKMEDLTLSAVAAPALGGFRLEAEFARVRLESEIPPALTLRADRKAVARILRNLVSNGVKFTPPGGTVRVGAEEAEGAIRLLVEDTGIGIPQDVLAKLGHPFEQANDQFTRGHRGSGLGLAITRSLARVHGGDVEIASTPGVGTRVTVVLPKAAQESGGPAG